MPFNSCGPRSSSSNRVEIRRRVDSVITTELRAASACRRAATWGVSPTAPEGMDASPNPSSPITTIPVLIPTRTASGCGTATAFTPSTISSPARTARSAASSCAAGQPKYTSTASPRYCARGRRSARRNAARLLVGLHYRPEILGIEAARELGRVGEVAEEDGELAPSGWTSLPTVGGRLGRARCRLAGAGAAGQRARRAASSLTRGPTGSPIPSSICSVRWGRVPGRSRGPRSSRVPAETEPVNHTETSASCSLPTHPRACAPDARRDSRGRPERSPHSPRMDCSISLARDLAETRRSRRRLAEVRAATLALRRPAGPGVGRKTGSAKRETSRRRAPTLTRTDDSQGRQTGQDFPGTCRTASDCCAHCEMRPKAREGPPCRRQRRLEGPARLAQWP